MIFRALKKKKILLSIILKSEKLYYKANILLLYPNLPPNVLKQIRQILVIALHEKELDYS